MKKLLESWNKFINEAEETRYELGYEDGHEGEEPYYEDDPQYMDGYNDGQMTRAKELER